MRILLAAFTLVPVLASAGTLTINGRDVIRIDVDDDEPAVRSRSMSLSELAAENERLRRRLKKLERAVRQLQDRTFDLENAPARTVIVPTQPSQPVQPRGKTEYTCYVKTTFKGTVMGKGSTEAEARAAALRDCEAKDGGFDCDDAKLKCGN